VCKRIERLDLLLDAAPPTQRGCWSVGANAFIGAFDVDLRLFRKLRMQRSESSRSSSMPMPFTSRYRSIDIGHQRGTLDKGPRKARQRRRLLKRPRPARRSGAHDLQRAGPLATRPPSLAGLRFS
jgi:hypothetical protein